MLPYHRLGAAKYSRLGRYYELKETDLYTKEQVERNKSILASFGLDVTLA